ncbi:MAG: HipA domain-containing protein [Betaproteobacteria bacterium]|nr:HipA domain-containing protein [Betaproteobacteria bacterium]
MPQFPILSVQPADVIGDEALGSKTKFWFRRDAEQWLFKETRENTGEDWAEKIAAEVAHLIGISAAKVELAEFEGRRGCALLSFASRDKNDVLIHGNEILAGMVLGYDRNKRFRQADHTLENIESAIRKLFPLEEISDQVLTTLAGYLVLDALIGNTDRHHENWAILLLGDRPTLSVAPSFDHASSLGRELQDIRREKLMRSGGVERYVRGGRGAIYLGPGDAHGANPLRLVEFGTRRFSKYFLPALRQLQRVSPAEFRPVLDSVPEERMSAVSKDFAFSIMSYTYDALVRLVK